MRQPLRSLLGAVGVFAALMVCGLVTRPLALAFPVPALHGLLMALPAAFLLTFALSRDVPVWACGIGVAAFALMLGAMSPAMGMATLIPLAVALIFYGFAGKFAPEARCMGAGLLGGALYFPLTFACSGSGKAFLASAELPSVALVVLLSLLGVALAVLGAALASVVKRKKG